MDANPPRRSRKTQEQKSAETRELLLEAGYGDDEIEAITRLRRRYRLGTRVNGLAEDVNEARRLIVTGVGIGFLPVLAAEDAVKAGKLWPILLTEFEPAYDIFLLARAQPSRDTATQLFIDEVYRRIRAQRRS